MRLVFILCLVLTSLHAQVSDPPLVKASVALGTPIVVQGVPVVLSLHLKATSAVTINLGENRTGALEVVAQRFASKTPVKFPVVTGFRPMNSFALDPKSVYEQTIILDASNFDQPGSYSLTINIDSRDNPPIQFDGGQTLQLTVTPYSEAAMRNACTELSQKIAGASTSEQRIQLSRALASIHDPIALPYLNSAIGHGWGVDYDVIRGIENIGTTEAVTLLAQAMRSDQIEVANSARAALIRLQKSGQTPEVRAQAQSSLSNPNQ